MKYLDLETLLAGAFYTMLSLWWFVSIATKYVSCVKANTEFSSRVTYPCCGLLSKLPVEGAVKLIAGSLLAVLSAMRCYTDCDEARKWGEATIFTIFAVSGLCDILTQKCQRYMFISIDYFILMFAFLIQSIVSSCHMELDSPLAVADECMMYAAATAALAVLLEFKFNDILWFSILRSYSAFLLGTWNCHIAFILNTGSEGDIHTKSNGTIFNVGKFAIPSNVTDVTIHELSLQEAESAEEMDFLLLVPMYFAWHCFLDMLMMTVLWLLLDKCYQRKICRRWCSTYEEENESYFQHHVHFDYQIVDRLDSDGE